MKSFTISEVAAITGLPDSTLRYYERIGLVDRITRHESSKQRVYSQDDVDRIVMIACLSATGMSIQNMHTYMNNRLFGPAKAGEQAELLRQRKEQVEIEIRKLQLCANYVEAKLAYWEAVETGDTDAIEKCAEATFAIADEMQLPKASRRQD